MDLYNDNVVTMDSPCKLASVGQKPVEVHVEIQLKATSTIKSSDLTQPVTNYLCRIGSSTIGSAFKSFTDPVLQNHVECILLSDSSDNSEQVQLMQATFQLHCYQLCSDGPGQESVDDEGELSAASHWILPASELHGLWESLVYDSEVKQQLLQYAATALLFSDCCVDHNIVDWNKVVLLHGPPGTGKTSLCKALAQKLSIRLSKKYSYGQLLEINSHSLFSKWFSESGKLVTKLFQKIHEMIDDPNALVCILIDEVESLTTARTASLSGNEPSDAIRVVNALLTQLDQIKRFPNVLVMTTSNVTGAIDLAFVDRADIKQYIGPPKQAAVYQILRSCIQELMRTGIVAAETVLSHSTMQTLTRNCSNGSIHNGSGDHSGAGQQGEISSRELWRLSAMAEGLSGRAMRKLPFLTHALYLKKSFVTLSEFLAGLEKAIQRQFQERESLTT